jgi:hypothetical protein
MLTDWIAGTRALSAGMTAATGNASAKKSAYVSAAACAECHREQFGKWTASRHARATDSLVIKQPEFDSSCFACHASGLEKNAGGEAGALPQLQNVHCEACHGPGSDHAKNPAKGYGRIASIKESCAICHTPEISPGFDAQTAWEKIKH